MASEDRQDGGEKTEDPSAYRLEEFRKKGDVANSREMTSAMVLIVSVVTLYLSIVYIYETIGAYMEWLYSLNVDKAFSENFRQELVKKTFIASFKCVAPVFISTFIVGILGNIFQFGIIFAPDILSMKLERIDPIGGFKRVFSAKSLVEAIKGVFKFAVILGIFYVYFKDNLDMLSGFLHVGAGESFHYGKVVVLKVMLFICLGIFLIALGDLFYQKISYKKKLMVTKQEQKEENKQQEGNPEVKQRIRTIQREISRKRMMKAVAKADVVITNPTHVSVAIQYNRLTMVSPIVVAKGVDLVALRIREIAKKHEIPLVENVPLARNLYKTVELNEAIPRTLYKAVAEILAFVYKLKKKKRAITSEVTG